MWEKKGIIKKQRERGWATDSFDDEPDFVVVASEGFDGPPELVWDVQLVGIEQQQDSIDAFSEPFLKNFMCKLLA